MGDLLDLVHQSSVKEVVEHLGITQFAARVRATHSLQSLYEKWKSIVYPEVQLKVGSIEGSATTETVGGNTAGAAGAGGAQGGNGNDKLAMCAHLWSIIQLNCLPAGAGGSKGNGPDSECAAGAGNCYNQPAEAILLMDGKNGNH
jgi:hypothetical protein